MADFEPAVAYVLHNKGGFIDNLHDSGRATNFGISLKFYKDIDPKANKDDIKNLTEDMAKEIYLKTFWNPNKFSLIAPQAVANKLFDMSVNMGVGSASLCMKRALHCLYPDEVEINETLNQDDFNKINNIVPMVIYHTFKSECAGHYRLIAETHTDQKVFLESWLNRAYQDLL